jgi:hypothetical protein
MFEQQGVVCSLEKQAGRLSGFCFLKRFYVETLSQGAPSGAPRDSQQSPSGTATRKTSASLLAASCIRIQLQA